ncbi:MAG TPA: ABC transporter permease [Chloroflexota bacterium]|nr:ABC transporter permease [Chloroflexota bacterium]
MSALIIAQLTVLEAVRRRLILVGGIISLVFIALYAIGFSFLYAHRPAAGGQAALVGAVTFLTVLGLYAVNFLSSFLSLFLTVGSVSGEIDNGTIQAILARPLRRSEYIMGRWLGFASIITCYVVIMACAFLAVARAVAGYEAPSPVQAVALMGLSALVLLTLGLLGSAILSTLANGVLVFSLFGLAWLAGIIEFLGNVLSVQGMVVLGIVISLIVPSDAIWRGASYYLQSPIVLAGLGGGRDVNPFASSVAPTPALIVWSVLHVSATLLSAAVYFSRRDL